jgi:hypothetical protein
VSDRTQALAFFHRGRNDGSKVKDKFHLFALSIISVPKVSPAFASRKRLRFPAGLSITIMRRGGFTVAGRKEYKGAQRSKPLCPS